MRTFPIVTAFATFLTVFVTPSLLAQSAQPENSAVTEASPDRTPPRLIVAISVDQFSADLFSEYRPYFTDGLKRLEQGAVFPSAYQSHAATETCPGHSTILTGAHPARTGIVANRWFDLDTPRDDKRIYCAEDESVVGSNSGEYTASPVHLLVPTLGERLKAANPAARNVAVAGKDRAALMMGGANTDAIYWWGGENFTGRDGRVLSGAAQTVNAQVAAKIARGHPGRDIPTYCASRNAAIRVNDDLSVGSYDFALPADMPQLFRTSPDMDAATLSLASALVDEQQLGRDAVPDVLSIGLSATDYVGHAFGTQGLEMCLQLAALDRELGVFFADLDAKGLDYVVMLTADHGGHDLPERLVLQAMPDAQRAAQALYPEGLSETIRSELDFGWTGAILLGDGPFGDMYITHEMNDTQRAAVLTAAKRILTGNDQVAAVFSAAEVMATPLPHGPVQSWSLAERARASFHPDRSGDFVVLLKPGITPIAKPSIGYVATHGSPWDYDRRVPLLFWRSGMTGFEQPNPVMTVDIAPTLAGLLGLASEKDAYDGRCLDLDGGTGNSCNSPAF